MSRELGELRITPDMVELSPGEQSDWMRVLYRFVVDGVASGGTVVARVVADGVSPAEAGRLLGMSRASVQRRIESGALRAVRDGSRWRVPRSEVLRYLEAMSRDEV